MRATILTLLLSIGLVATTYAQNSKSDKTITHLEQIATLDVGKKQVKQMLGEPKEISVVKGKTRWIYRDKAHFIHLEWDDNKALLTNFTYSTKAEMNNWDASQVAQLEIEKTTVNKVINQFGTPSELMVKNASQRIIYQNSNRRLLLQFKAGILEKYVLTRT